MAGVEASLPSPSPATPEGRVMNLSILQILFACRLAGDRDLPPIWVAVARGKIRMEGLTTLNQMLMRGIPFCRRVFGERARFSVSLPLFTFLKKIHFGTTPWNQPTMGGGGGGYSKANAPGDG